MPISAIAGYLRSLLPARGTRAWQASRFLKPGWGSADRHTSTNAAFSRMAVPSLSRLSTTRSEEHTSELQSLMRISYAVFCLKKKKQKVKKGTIARQIYNKQKLYIGTIMAN